MARCPHGYTQIRGESNCCPACNQPDSAPSPQMTPPDSGELRHECQCGYRVIGRDEVLVTHDANHTWLQCVPAVAEVKPDSGEHEARINLAEIRRFWASAVAADSETAKEVMRMCDELERRRAGVYLDSSLVQRILAALNAHANRVDLATYSPQRLRALADELREVMPRSDQPQERK